MGPADVVAAAQMIYSGEESLGLKLDTTGADTFRVGIVCVADGRALERRDGAPDEHTWLVPINTHKHLDVYAISETRCKISACMWHKIIPVHLSLCVYVL